MSNEQPIRTQHKLSNWSTWLLNEQDVARITCLSVASVRRWRILGQGPKFLKINSAVRYRPEDLEAWLASRPAGGGKGAL